jgi:porphobilinogen synthase
MVCETRLHPARLIQPLFVMEGEGPAQPIASLPGQRRLPIGGLVAEARRLHAGGLRGIALFPVVDAADKSADGSTALDAECLVLRAIRAVKAAVPGIIVFADIALDPYTTHGHDGILNADGCDVDNDATVQVLARMAVLTAAAGADFVAPSDMMDGRVRALRVALDEAGHCGCGILAYAAKFNSAFYGPFRDAVGSARAAGAYLDKSGYQLDPANRRQALRELQTDAAEGADMLMVKPAGPYLDIIADASTVAPLPVAAYQVSGEYAQIIAAANNGWIERDRARDESLIAIHRAGADLILSYFAHEYINGGAGGG